MEEVSLYKHILPTTSKGSIDAPSGSIGLPQAAVDLAAPLLDAVRVRWFAVGPTPFTCMGDLQGTEESPKFHVQSGATAYPNTGDHLDESRSPEMLVLREASVMLTVGIRVILRGFPGLEQTLARDYPSQPAKSAAVLTHDVGRGATADVEIVRAGAQLVTDAYLADPKCSTMNYHQYTALEPSVLWP